LRPAFFPKDMVIFFALKNNPEINIKKRTMANIGKICFKSSKNAKNDSFAKEKFTNVKTKYRAITDARKIHLLLFFFRESFFIKRIKLKWLK
jgi:hypothetical protein